MFKVWGPADVAQVDDIGLVVSLNYYQLDVAIANLS